MIRSVSTFRTRHYLTVWRLQCSVRRKYQEMWLRRDRCCIATGCSLLRLTQQVDRVVVTNYENYHNDKQNLVLRERRTSLGTLVYGLEYFLPECGGVAGLARTDRHVEMCPECLGPSGGSRQHKSSTRNTRQDASVPPTQCR